MDWDKQTVAPQDFTSFDFFLWGNIKNEVYDTEFNNINSFETNCVMYNVDSIAFKNKNIYKYK